MAGAGSGDLPLRPNSVLILTPTLAGCGEVVISEEKSSFSSLVWAGGGRMSYKQVPERPWSADGVGH